MIMSVLGQTTLAEAERDTEETGLAEDAVIEREGHKANRACPNHSRGFGETSKTKQNQKGVALALPRGLSADSNYNSLANGGTV